MVELSCEEVLVVKFSNSGLFPALTVVTHLLCNQGGHGTIMLEGGHGTVNCSVHGIHVYCSKTRARNVLVDSLIVGSLLKKQEKRGVV